MLNIAIFIALLSVPITYMMWKKRWDGPKTGRAYIRKYFWGLRFFLFPAIAVHVLLRTDLKTYCAALFVFAIILVLLKLIFGTDRRSRPTDILGYLWYAALGLTWYYNQVDFLQIWFTIAALFAASYSLAAFVFKKPHWLDPSVIFPSANPSPLKIKMNYIFYPIGFLLIAAVNEGFRRFTSFETWAFYNAFWMPIFAFVSCGLAVIIIPLFFDENGDRPKGKGDVAGKP